jgi:hypothetical protein
MGKVVGKSIQEQMREELSKGESFGRGIHQYIRIVESTAVHMRRNDSPQHLFNTSCHAAPDSAHVFLPSHDRPFLLASTCTHGLFVALPVYLLLFFSFFLFFFLKKKKEEYEFKSWDIRDLRGNRKKEKKKKKSFDSVY